MTAVSLISLLLYQLKVSSTTRQITSFQNMLGMSGMVVGMFYFSHGFQYLIAVRFSPHSLTNTLNVVAAF